MTVAARFSESRFCKLMTKVAFFSETSVLWTDDSGSDVLWNVGFVNWWHWQRSSLKRRLCKLMIKAAFFSETSILWTDDSDSEVLWNVGFINWWHWQRGSLKRRFCKLMTLAAGFSETSVIFYHSPRHHVLKTVMCLLTLWEPGILDVIQFCLINPLCWSVCALVCVLVAPTVAKAVCVIQYKRQHFKSYNSTKQNRKCTRNVTLRPVGVTIFCRISIIFTESVCVSVALVIQHAMHMRHIYIVICDLSGCTMFS